MSKLISVPTTQEINRMVSIVIEELNVSSRFLKTKNFMQHGTISVYEHCIEVAYTSCYIAAHFKIDIDYWSMIRGALLHDYFLYDWHISGDGSHHLHGFTHPKRAFMNAVHDLNLNRIERIVILRHMFPLTPIPPTNREAWLVCLADKICATRETLHFTKTKAAIKYGSIRQF